MGIEFLDRDALVLVPQCIGPAHAPVAPADAAADDTESEERIAAALNASAVAGLELWDG